MGTTCGSNSVHSTSRYIDAPILGRKRTGIGTNDGSENKSWNDDFIDLARWYACLSEFGITLSYPSRFDNDTRNVTLQGEAYFEVAKNPEKKFIVSTSHQSQIEVLGTHFNVEAYEKEDRISATLVEGKIGFIYTSNDARKKC